MREGGYGWVLDEPDPPLEYQEYQDIGTGEQEHKAVLTLI